jgi:cytochrome P450
MTARDAERLTHSAEADAARNFDIMNLPQGYYENPYIWFKRLRDHDPMHRNADGGILLTRYEDVRAVWSDLTCVVNKAEMFEKRWGKGALLDHYTSMMVFRDPPDHDRLRRIVNPFFFRAAIENQRPYVERKVAALIDEIEERGEVNLLTDFAARLPIGVICNVLGVPEEDGPMLQALGGSIMAPLNVDITPAITARGNEAVEIFAGYLTEFFARARNRSDLDPRENVVNALIAAERAGDKISEREMLDMCIMLVTAGHETTTSVIATTIHTLIDEPEAAAVFRDSQASLDNAIEECIRFVSPVQFQNRRTTRQIEISSGVIEPNTEVLVCQASANRDERIFENAERLDLKRQFNPKTPQIAFGAGIHTCLGQYLARLETRIAFPAFFQRFGKIERTGEAEFVPFARARGLKSLPVRLAR